MAGLGNLDAFIEGCDATKMSAFLELVHRRFSEAQAQKQKRMERFVSNLHEQVVTQKAAKKVQLEQQISGTLSSLSKKRDLAAAELGQRLEEARTKKRTLLLSFQEQEKACQDVEEEMQKLVQQYTLKQQAMEKSQKQALRQFFEEAVQKVKSAQDRTTAALEEAEGERQQAAHMLLQLLVAYSGPEAVALLSGLNNNWR